MAQASVKPEAASAIFEFEGERIELDPHRAGRAYARLAEHERPVWALIGDLRGNGWDLKRTARAYNLPISAVRAAVAYYRSDPRFIDAFLLLNEDGFASIGSA